MFYDSVFQNAPFLTEKQVFFNPIKLDSAGTFKLQTWVYIADDQVRSNDTLSTIFNVIDANDIQLLSVVKPELVEVKGSPSSPLSITIRNHGNANANAVKIVANVENNRAEVILYDSIYINLNRLTSYEIKVNVYVKELTGKFCVVIFHFFKSRTPSIILAWFNASWKLYDAFLDYYF